MVSADGARVHASLVVIIGHDICRVPSFLPSSDPSPPPQATLSADSLHRHLSVQVQRLAAMRHSDGERRHQPLFRCESSLGHSKRRRHPCEDDSGSARLDQTALRRPGAGMMSDGVVWTLCPPPPRRDKFASTTAGLGRADRCGVGLVRCIVTTTSTTGHRLVLVRRRRRVTDSVARSAAAADARRCCRSHVAPQRPLLPRTRARRRHSKGSFRLGWLAWSAPVDDQGSDGRPPVSGDRRPVTNDLGDGHR